MDEQETLGLEETIHLHIEAVRQAELSREDLDLSNEYDVAVYAIWYLLNPVHAKERDSVGTSEVCHKQIPEETAGFMKFTAHGHHHQPLLPSPDDRRLYASLRNFSYAFIHFVTDRFRIGRIK